MKTPWCPEIFALYLRLSKSSSQSGFDQKKHRDSNVHNTFSIRRTSRNPVCDIRGILSGAGCKALL